MSHEKMIIDAQGLQPNERLHLERFGDDILIVSKVTIADPMATFIWWLAIILAALFVVVAISST